MSHRRPGPWVYIGDLETARAPASARERAVEDFQTRMQQLTADAAECDLIANLATEKDEAGPL